MSEYAVMPVTDYINTCEKIREKTSSTAVIKSGEMADKIEKVYEKGQLSVFERSETLTGYVSGYAVGITDIAPIEHNLNITLFSTVEGMTDFSNVKVSQFGKNWLNIKNREVVALGESYQSVPREFTGNKVFLGITATNVIRSHYITDYFIDEDNGTIEVTSTETAYGLGFDIKVKPNTTYCVSYGGSGTTAIGYFDKDGKYLSYKTLYDKYFTTPEGAVWVVIVFRTTVNNTETTYSNNQVELGRTPTGYEPYIEPITVFANADGTVKGLKSIYPNTTLTTDTDGVVDCIYYKDIDKVFNNLAMNIAVSGG